jgi:hypothetical protein
VPVPPRNRRSEFISVFVVEAKGLMQKITQIRFCKQQFKFRPASRFFVQARSLLAPEFMYVLLRGTFVCLRI